MIEQVVSSRDGFLIGNQNLVFVILLTIDIFVIAKLMFASNIRNLQTALFSASTRMRPYKFVCREHHSIVFTVNI